MSKVGVRNWRLQRAGMLPPSRKGGSMAYDASRGVVVLFGGSGRNDTWLWDGAIWRELFPAIVPPARTSGMMAYDAVHKHTVLFGGADSQGLPLNDTWLWDGATWHEYYTPHVPPARSGAAMSYDEARQHIILFGGQTYGGRAGTLLNDTWAWNGSRWYEIASPSAPYARLGANMAHHAGSGSLVLFGGTAGHTTFRDTWLWNGEAWREAETAVAPPARAWATMAYHSDIRQVVLVGGSGHDWQTGSPLALGDTWVWDGSGWQPLSSLAAPRGSYHSASYDAARQVIVVYATTGGKPEQASKANDQLQDTYASLSSETWLW